MPLEDFIKSAPGFRVVKRGETPRETARNVYDVALAISGLSEAEDQKNGVVMAIRASGCLVALIRAAKGIESDIHEELGLTGGATGSASFADLQYLSKEDALRLAQITATVKELESMKPDVLAILQQVREAA